MISAVFALKAVHMLVYAYVCTQLFGWFFTRMDWLCQNISLRPSVQISRQIFSVSTSFFPLLLTLNNEDEQVEPCQLMKCG
jgi:hypothetical protein